MLQCRRSGTAPRECDTVETAATGKRSFDIEASISKRGLVMKKTFSCFILCILAVAAETAAIENEKRYRIGPGDALEVSVWKEEDLTRQIIVPPDGIISFPLIEDIDAKQLSIADLEKEIAEKLSKYIPDAAVTVMLLAANSQRAYVTGKVRSPGQFPITMETNIMQLLSMAGGLADFASEKNILILRQMGGQTVKIPFDYGRVKKGEKLEQNIVVKAGDVVVVR